MSKRDTRPIEVGDRFETRDDRDAGRIVEVDELLGVADASGTRFRIRTEVHPRNPSAQGTVRIANERTLRTKYKRVSR